MSNIFLLSLAYSQRLKRELDKSRKALNESLAAGLEKLIPVGSVIDRREKKFGTIRVSHGNGRNAMRYEVASRPVAEIDLSHPGLSRFTIDAYALNDAGKRMSGRVAKSYGIGMRDTVQLSIDILPGFQDEDLNQELERLACIADVT